MTRNYMTAMLEHNFGISEQKAADFADNSHMTDRMKDSFVTRYDANTERLQRLEDRMEKLDGTPDKGALTYAEMADTKNEISRVETEQSILFHAFNNDGEMQMTVTDPDRNFKIITLEPQESVWGGGFAENHHGHTPGQVTNGEGGFGMRLERGFPGSGVTTYGRGNIPREDARTVNDLLRILTNNAEREDVYSGLSLLPEDRNKMVISGPRGEEGKWRDALIEQSGETPVSADDRSADRTGQLVERSAPADTADEHAGPTETTLYDDLKRIFTSDEFLNGLFEKAEEFADKLGSKDVASAEQKDLDKQEQDSVGREDVPDNLDEDVSDEWDGSDIG